MSRNRNQRRVWMWGLSVRWRHGLSILMLGILAVLSGCAATTPQIIPTPRPSLAPSETPTPTVTREQLPTASPSPVRPGGATPTPLFGSTATPALGESTATRPPNPNAPRVEFFESNGPIEPGAILTLLWSTRNVDRAVIYQLDRQGDRTRLWNVAPVGNQLVQTSKRDRGQLDFLLVIGAEGQQVEQRLRVPLVCNIAWFFEPAPDECADDEAVEVFLAEQLFERGRMLYIGDEDRVYALFNDGASPAWLRFDNQFDPATDPDRDPNFPDTPGFFQPTGRLGFVWRGNDTVRNRLGLAIEAEVAFEGVVQRATLTNGVPSIYATSPDGTVLQIIGTGGSWQIITAN